MTLPVHLMNVQKQITNTQVQAHTQTHTETDRQRGTKIPWLAHLHSNHQTLFCITKW